MKTKVIFLLGAMCFVIIFCTGCGETVRGMGKDAHRIGQGVRTVFVADE